MNLKGGTKLLGTLVVRGCPEEVFFSYGYDRKKSKVLYSHNRKRIPNSFTGTIFNRHRNMIESGEVEGDFSNIYFFLPAITNRPEEINQYLGNVSKSSVGITQSQLNDWARTKFDLSKLDLFGLEKNTMTHAVVKCLKHIMCQIVKSHIMPMVCSLERRLRCLWTGLVRIKNMFHHRNLKSPINFLF